MSNDDLVIVESIVEVNRPRYTKNDLSAMNAPAVGLWFSWSVFVGGMYAYHPLVLGVGASGVVVFTCVLVGQYSLIAGMVSTQTTTNYYESLDNRTDDNLNYSDEVEEADGYQSPFVEWGTDVELFKRLLSRYVKAGEYISRDGAIVPANADYQQQKGKPAIPNLTKNFGKPYYRVQEAFIMAVMTDELEGDKKKMKPSAHLLSYK